MKNPTPPIDASNPYAAPATTHPVDADTVSVGMTGSFLWLAVSTAVQAGWTTFVVDNLKCQMFGVIEMPFVHLIVTTSVILTVTLFSLRRCSPAVATFTAQATNFLLWGVFLVTVTVMDALGHDNAHLSRKDYWIFFGLFAAGAAVTGTLCYSFGRKQRPQGALPASESDRQF